MWVYLERSILEFDFDRNALNTVVDKNHLYPLAPPLTRYEETVIPIMKKKVQQHKLLEDDVSKKLNELTISNLCIRLNTLKVSAALINLMFLIIDHTSLREKCLFGWTIYNSHPSHVISTFLLLMRI